MDKLIANPMTATINGIQYAITEDQQYINYERAMYEIIDDQDGEYYFILNGKTVYFTPTESN